MYAPPNGRHLTDRLSGARPETRHQELWSYIRTLKNVTLGGKEDYENLAPRLSVSWRCRLVPQRVHPPVFGAGLICAGVRRCLCFARRGRHVELCQSTFQTAREALRFDIHGCCVGTCAYVMCAP